MPTMTETAVKSDLIAQAIELRKQFEPHKFFVPNVSQRRLIVSPAKEKWAFMGNGTGKSAMLCLCGIWHMTGDYPAYFPEAHKCTLPSNGGYSTTTFTNATEKGLMTELQKWVPGGLGRAKERRFHWDRRTKRLTDRKTKSILDFFSYDQDPKDWAGSTKDYWLWDEHGTHDHYQEGKRSLRGIPGTFYAGLTPTEGMSWEFDTIYEQADGINLEIFQGDTSDNQANLPADYIATLTRGLTEDQSRMRLAGEFIELAGLVYPHFDPTVHVCDYFDVNDGDAAIWPKIVVIDPGYRNPCAALWFTVDPDTQLWFYREYYEAKRTIRENAKAIWEETEKDEAIVYCLMDPEVLGHGLDSHKTKLEQFEDAFMDEGCTWPIYPANNDKIAGIPLVRGRLQDGTIHFFPDLINTFKEFRRYVHTTPRFKSRGEKNKLEEAKKFMDHLMDDIRYGCMDEPQYYDVSQKVEAASAMTGVLSSKTGY